jgi:hypothetical protein
MHALCYLLDGEHPGPWFRVVRKNAQGTFEIERAVYNAGRVKEG